MLLFLFTEARFIQDSETIDTASHSEAYSNTDVESSACYPGDQEHCSSSPTSSPTHSEASDTNLSVSPTRSISSSTPSVTHYSSSPESKFNVSVSPGSSPVLALPVPKIILPRGSQTDVTHTAGSHTPDTPTSDYDIDGISLASVDSGSEHRSMGVPSVWSQIHDPLRTNCQKHPTVIGLTNTGKH